jgi:DnaK suppressor protein
LTQLFEQRDCRTHVRVDDTTGNVDRVGNQVATERDLEFAINERETAELAALENALARWRDGTYGRCIDCDADIPAARLLATPEAARCMACQEKTESHPH